MHGFFSRLTLAGNEAFTISASSPVVSRGFSERALIMFSAIRRHIENHFGENLSDDELEDIRESCSDFDDIYVDCKAYDFFCSMGAAEFVGIEDMQLKDIVKKGRNSNGTT